MLDERGGGEGEPLQRTKKNSRLLYYFVQWGLGEGYCFRKSYNILDSSTNSTSNWYVVRWTNTVIIFFFFSHTVCAVITVRPGHAVRQYKGLLCDLALQGYRQLRRKKRGKNSPVRHMFSFTDDSMDLIHNSFFESFTEHLALCSRQILHNGSILKELLRIKLRFDLGLTWDSVHGYYCLIFKKVGLTWAILSVLVTRISGDGQLEIADFQTCIIVAPLMEKRWLTRSLICASTPGIK